ncbi:MAG: glycosyltransferase family 39 protein [Chloroflexota bacterium]
MNAVHLRLLAGVLLILVVVGAGAARLNADPIWYDEWWSLYYAGHEPEAGPATLPGTLTRVAQTDHELNPPGYYALLNVWGDAAGTHPAMLRVWSVLMGAVAVAAVLRAGDYVGRSGVWAALLLAFSAFFVYYTHEARAYMQMVCFTALVIASYLSYWQGGRTSRLLVLGAATAGVLYTHYMGAFFLAAAALVHLTRFERSRRWWGVVVAVAIAGVLFLPWVGVAFSAFTTVSGDAARDFFARSSVDLGYRLVRQFSNGNVGLFVVLALSGASVPLLATRERWQAAFIPVLTVGTFALSVLANDLFEFVTDVHYLLALFPLLALLGGMGLACLPRSVSVVVVAVWAGAGFLLWVTPREREAGEWKLYAAHDEMAAALAPLTWPGDDVVIYLPEPDPNWIHFAPVDYYAGHLALDIDLLESLPGRAPDEYAAKMREYVNDDPLVWTVRDRRVPPSQWAQHATDALTADYVSCYATPLDEPLQIALYARPEAAETVVFDDGNIEIDVLAVDTVAEGEALRVLVNMRAGEAVPPFRYSVALHLLDSSGALVQQVDFSLPPETPACHMALLPLPEAETTLNALVYAWETGERLLAADGETYVPIAMP